MCYKVDSYGLVIGLIDNQSSMTSEKLFVDEFKDGIFYKYKKGVNDNLGESGKLADFLYNPKGYHLFGDCNMAILSVIDDFVFPNRVLHGSHGYVDTDMKYTLQVISGICTVDTTPSLSKQAANTFLKVTEPFHFIGITNYKINTGLLLGNGTDLLELIKRKIRNLQDSDYEDVQCICLDSFSNHELTVLYFSNKLNRIELFINKTRTLQLEELTQSVDSLAKQSLMWQYLIENEDKKMKQVKDAHIFSSTYSHLGYDMKLDRLDDEMIIQYHWDLKPGHYHSFIAYLGKLLQISLNDKDITPGLDMIHFKCRKTFSAHLEDWNKLISDTSISSCIRRQRMYVVFNEIEIEHTEFLGEEHPTITGKYQESIFGRAVLRELRDNLDEFRVSKVLKERTLKMYGTYNDCITDPLFFSYFIELRDYLKGIKTQIVHYKQEREKSLENFHSWLNAVITNFEKAYYNRFHQSSRMKNISDFNLEYNGGIQQLISAYDVAYKTISKIYTREYQQNFVYVSGYERVSSDRNSLRINIFHITYPELYAATIWKEVANFCWDSEDKISDGSIEAENILANELLITDPNYSFILQSRIKSHVDFDFSSYVHCLMLSAMNDTFIHYLCADTTVYNYGYAANFDLYSYWYWKYFSQMSHFYDYEGEMNPDVFIKFFMRLAFIETLCKKESGTFIEYVPFDPKLSELWFCYSRDIYSFVRILLEELEISDFQSYVSGSFMKLIYHEVQENKRESSITYQQFKEASADHMATWLDNTQRRCVEFQKQFENGEIISSLESFSPQEFVRHIFYSYLYAVKSLDLQDDQSIKVLERDNKGEVVWRNQYTQIPADPLGGMFTCSKSIREQYLKYRSVFYKSLWGFSLQVKKNYVDV